MRITLVITLLITSLSCREKETCCKLYEEDRVKELSDSFNMEFESSDLELLPASELDKGEIIPFQDANEKHTNNEKEVYHKISILAFKEEQILQVYSNEENENKFIKEFPFTGYIGNLGPKLKQGDDQIPEGIYKVIGFNPESKFHLSIKINYPNQFDFSKTKLYNKKQLGGNIFIHGGYLTIGCIPIGNTAIEELYYMAEETNNEIQVIISPRDFRINNEFPNIESIEWENELYELINNELCEYPINNVEHSI